MFIEEFIRTSGPCRIEKFIRTSGLCRESHAEAHALDDLNAPIYIYYNYNISH
jgi:hypothetical protein